MRAIVSLVLSLCLFSSAAFAQQEGEPIDLEIGAQTSISTDGVIRYSEGRGGIVEVRLTSDESDFVIVGIRAGVTSLLLIMEDGTQRNHRITVTDPSVEEEYDGVNARENVRLDLYFVRVSESFSHQIGIGYPASINRVRNEQGSFEGSISGGTGSDLQLTWGMGFVSFLPRIDIAQSNGWARLFRHGVLITANGSEAEFSAGGEVNVVTQGTVGAQVVRIEFGTLVKCTPRYDSATGRVELSIQAEVSDLTPSDSAGGAPGRQLTTINTLVNLDLGESIVLAGFEARSQTRSRSGLPGLSQIPILGALFGVHSGRTEESEGVMFIVPSVEDSVPISRRNRIEEAMRAYEDFSGDVDDSELVETPNTN